MEAQGSFRPADVDSVTIGATDYVGFVCCPPDQGLQREAPNTACACEPSRARRAGPVAAGLVDVRLGTFPHVPARPAARRCSTSSSSACCAKAIRAGARPVIDQYGAPRPRCRDAPWDGRGAGRRCAERLGRTQDPAYVPHFLVAPRIVAETDLVLTTGRGSPTSCGRGPLGLAVLPRRSSSAVRRALVWHPPAMTRSVDKCLRSVVRAARRRCGQPTATPDRRRRRSAASGRDGEGADGAGDGAHRRGRAFERDGGRHDGPGAQVMTPMTSRIASDRRSTGAVQAERRRGASGAGVGRHR